MCPSGGSGREATDAHARLPEPEGCGLQHSHPRVLHVKNLGRGRVAGHCHAVREAQHSRKTIRVRGAVWRGLMSPLCEPTSDLSKGRPDPRLQGQGGTDCTPRATDAGSRTPWRLPLEASSHLGGTRGTRVLAQETPGLLKGPYPQPHTLPRAWRRVPVSPGPVPRHTRTCLGAATSPPLQGGNQHRTHRGACQAWRSASSRSGPAAAGESIPTPGRREGAGRPRQARP